MAGNKIIGAILVLFGVVVGLVGGGIWGNGNFGGGLLLAILGTIFILIGLYQFLSDSYGYRIGVGKY